MLFAAQIRLTMAILIVAAATNAAFAQAITYLPQNAKYSDKVPSPQEFFGFEIGERHLRHDQLTAYLQVLAEKSQRVKIAEYARTHGDRPLVLLTITDRANHAQLERIRQQHLQLAEPEHAAEVDIKSLPAVINMGYGVHGNEPSASNAAALVAYHLAACTDANVADLLQETIVLLDPCLNPEGFDRFANWANNHRGQVLNADRNHREHQESWPSGRTNYYWFDLNRDWLPLQHPESQGRMVQYQRWLPNVLLDFHEMGTDATYFFQPGVPQRNHPLTPENTFLLTRKMAAHHARALDSIGSLYFTEERFDDFYFGKGSTYPDLHGGVGILFEQASARGHLQESTNGPVSFPFTIRNHFATSLSSLQATREMRMELLTHKREFYSESVILAKHAAVKGYVFSAQEDPVRLFHFLKILHQHGIRVHKLAENLKVGNQVFLANDSYLVPAQQRDYRLITALFEKRTEFKESIFYDVSTWTLPLAFQLKYAEVTETLPEKTLASEPVTPQFPQRNLLLQSGELAFLIDWRGYSAAKTLYRLLEADVKVKVAHDEFRALVAGGKERDFARGTLLVPLGIQPEKAQLIREQLATAARDDGVAVYSARTGLTPSGIDFGSSSFAVIKKPKVLLVTGGGVSAYDAGEVWHLLDHRFSIPVTMVDEHRLNQVKLDDYTVVVLVNGNYSSMTDSAIAKLKDWLTAGGTLIATGTASQSVAAKNLAKISFRPIEDSAGSVDAASPPSPRPYAEAEERAALQLISGAIFETVVDATHPIGYGYANNVLPIFRRNRLVLELSKNPYATPVVYSKAPLLSGYASANNVQALSMSAGVVVDARGRGRVIAMVDNPNFRAFWYGTNRLFLNSIFFGPMVDVP